jgi:hypothetical protein
MKALLLIPMTVFFLASASAQTKDVKIEGATEAKVEMKEHVCTSACADGKHAYACGEKGHECSKECMAKHVAMKDHVCTEACKGGKHAYACGEKGHTCSADCKKKHAKAGAMKEHVCTAACSEDAHAYACGEKGHTCSAECMKKEGQPRHDGHEGHDHN